MIVDRPVKDKVIEEAKRNGAYFVNSEEKVKLEKAVKKGRGINPDVVGKSAAYIAEYAGFSVPENTSVLIAECTGVGHDEPLSIEKLSPVLALYIVEGWLEGCHKCIELLEFGGIGHTLAIHSNDKDIILKFALEKPAFRIVVNTPSSVGAVGYTTAANPSMTLGPGTWGGSIISENVTAKHLINYKTLAFETNPINQGKSVSSFEGTSAKLSSSSSSFMEQIEDRLRARAGNPPAESFKNNPSKQKEVVLGTGISESEIKRIIKEFNS
jgi:acetaldehyde dehydrogenase (acetylating)